MRSRVHMNNRSIKHIYAHTHIHIQRHTSCISRGLAWCSVLQYIAVRCSVLLQCVVAVCVVVTLYTLVAVVAGQPHADRHHLVATTSLPSLVYESHSQRRAMTNSVHVMLIQHTLPQHTATTLQQHCNNTATTLQQYCNNTATTRQQHSNADCVWKPFTKSGDDTFCTYNGVYYLLLQYFVAVCVVLIVGQ